MSNHLVITENRGRELALSVLPRLLTLRPQIHRARVGACLCDRRGNVIEIGFNRLRTHPRAARWHARAGRPFCTTVHAEMDALIRLDQVPVKRDAFLVVSRIRRTGPATQIITKKCGVFETCLALPCAGCMEAIGDLGVKRVLFTTNDNSIGDLRL